jgi:hypothetical protein
MDNTGNGVFVCPDNHVPVHAEAAYASCAYVYDLPSNNRIYPYCHILLLFCCRHNQL